MTDHGFIGLLAGSPIDQKTLYQIASAISKISWVRWVHIVNTAKGSVNLNIIIEFDPRHEKNPIDLRDEIKAKAGEHADKPISVWKIQCSLRGPKHVHACKHVHECRT